MKDILVNNNGKNYRYLTRFGFTFERGGAHLSRTVMLEELRTLLAYVDNPEATPDDYLRAIDEENCLGKRSGQTRRLSFRHLRDLYALDPSAVLFRTLRYFWSRDPNGQPLLALLCAYARDAILRSSAPLILAVADEATVSREAVEDFIDAQEPRRFSKSTLKSTAQNIRSTWTKAGYLTGHVYKVRSTPMPTAGSVAYALFLGYLTGARGALLFQTEYVKLLECPFDRAVELAEEASRRGWIVFKRVDDVIEVLFPALLSAQEMEWLREQS